jgi:maltose O-acetyltransferase
MKYLRKVFWRLKAKLGSYRAGGQIVFGKTKIKVPLACAGNKGTIIIGDKSSFGDKYAPMSGDGRILLQARERATDITIGLNTSFSNNVSMIARESISIGNDFLCGDGVRIMDSDFHEVAPEQRLIGKGKTSSIVIGNNVWLGSGVMILKGVIIGDHSIVASGSVVTKNVPGRVIVGGIPSQVIRQI